EATQITSMLGQVLKNKTLWLIAAFSFSTTFFFIGWNAWAPALIIDKGAPPEQAAYISSIIHWITIPSLLLAPRLSNRIGVRKPFLWLTSAILAVITLWAMYATVNVMLFLMVILGLVNSARQITNQTLPIEIMSKEVVGTASGLIMSIGFSGGVVGPIITGYILDTTGSFNMSLLVLVIISIIAMGIAFKIPETGPKVRLNQ
ncbi:MFS transporter, partial [Chloroflexota bacterium]